MTTTAAERAVLVRRWERVSEWPLMVERSPYAGLGLIVLHLRAMGQPVAVGDLGDLET
jgi:hypothetical protein